MNWDAVIPNLITGVVGVAGIAGTIVAARIARRSAAENMRANVIAAHQRWLRESRADLYVELMSFLQACEERRDYMARFGSWPELREQGNEMADTYNSDEMTVRKMRTFAYASREATIGFEAAITLDMGFRAYVAAADESPEARAELKRLAKEATSGGDSFMDRARDDLQAMPFELD